MEVDIFFCNCRTGKSGVYTYRTRIYGVTVGLLFVTVRVGRTHYLVVT